MSPVGTTSTPTRAWTWGLAGVLVFFAPRTPAWLGVVLVMVTSIIAFAGILYAVGAYVAGRAVPGWSSVLSIVSFQFGVLFTLPGIIGEYVGKILLEVKRRPRFLIHEQLDEQHAHRSGLREDPSIAGNLSPLAAPQAGTPVHSASAGGPATQRDVS